LNIRILGLSGIGMKNEAIYSEFNPF